VKLIALLKGKLERLMVRMLRITEIVAVKSLSNSWIGMCAWTFKISAKMTRTTSARVSQKSPSVGSENDPLTDISVRVNELVARSKQTGERLEKLERTRIMNEESGVLHSARSKPNLGSVFPVSEQRNRPTVTEFHVPRNKSQTSSKDVTLHQIFDALQSLREEVADLSDNHTEMVDQITTIKRLIH
jgi:hypothetical protein